MLTVIIFYLTLRCNEPNTYLVGAWFTPFTGRHTLMNWQKLGLLTLLLIGEAGAQTTFAGNAQHTAIYSPAAQNLNAVHWTTSIDLDNSGGYAHYGAPLI